jgi:hypothetical protein
MSPTHQSEIVDQLVCGTLRGSAYQEALEWLESHPQHWRDCALAFLQEQAVEQELQQLARQSLDWHTAQDSKVVEKAAIELPADFGKSEFLEQPTQELSDKHWNQRLAVQLAGLAALLFLSFGIGWMSGTTGNQSLQTAQDSASQDGSLLAGAVDHRERHLAGSDLKATARQEWSNQRRADSGLGSQSTSESSLRNVRFDQDSQPSWVLSGSDIRNNPTLIGNLSRRLLPIDQEIPRELLELERLGRIRIETSSALLPIENEDGSSVLVPVQQLQIVPVLYSY